jgi:hypothetical protein
MIIAKYQQLGTEVAQEYRSITFTVLICFGMMVALVGLLFTVAGLGGSNAIELSFSRVTLKTTSLGLAILAIGTGLSAGIALNLPENVQVFGRTKPTISERLRRFVPIFSILAILAAAAFFLTVLI